MPSRQSTWESVSVSLVITKDDLAPALISQKLLLDGSVTREPGQEPHFRQGDGLWVYGYDDTLSPDPEQQLDALLDDLADRREAVAELIHDGFSVQIDVAGFVATGDSLWIRPEVLQRVNDLGIPLSFTTRCTVREDDFDWLWNHELPPRPQ